MGPLPAGSAAASQTMLPASLWQAGVVRGGIKRLSRPVQAHLALFSGFSPLQTAFGSRLLSDGMGGAASSESAFMFGGRSEEQLPVGKQRRWMGVPAVAGNASVERPGGAFEWDAAELKQLQQQKKKWMRERADRAEPVEEPARRASRDGMDGARQQDEDRGVMWPKAAQPISRAPRPATLQRAKAAIPRPSASRPSDDSADEDWGSKTWGKAVMEDRRPVTGGDRELEQEKTRRTQPAPWERAAGKASVSNEGFSRRADFEPRRGEGLADAGFARGQEGRLAESRLAKPKRKPSYQREPAGDGLAATDLPGTSNASVLLGRTLEELTAFAVEHGEPKFRGKQLYDALYKQKVQDWSQITGLSKAWREKLEAAGFQIGRAPVHTAVQAKDGTAKLLLRLHDGRLVETVGIPGDSHGKEDAASDGLKRKGHLTACISSQVGCALKCAFCATGKGGFSRHLEAHEIVDQVLAIEQFFGERVSNIVFMGMGEPMLNLKNVLPAFRSINKDVGIGQRSITISTVGVPNSIAMLAAYKLQATLAVSLHAPNQRLREQIIPSARSYPLSALLTDCRDYFAKTGRRVSFEYTLLAGVNDSYHQAKELAELLYEWKLAHHVNVIPYNPVEDSQFKRPDRAAVQTFVDTLVKHKLTASIRRTRGLEANAACGQLRNAFQKTPLGMEDKDQPVLLNA